MSYSRAAEQINSFPIPNNADQSYDYTDEARAQATPCTWISQGRVSLLLLLIALSLSCTPNQPLKERGNERGETTGPVTPVDQNASLQPSSASSVHNDPNLTRILDTLLDSQEFGAARWGVAIISLRDGKLIYQRNGDKLFTPASNMKIYTTAVALDLLGAEYRWRTSVYSEFEPDANGIIRGDLVLYGRGAPDLQSANTKDNTNSLEELALALVKRGVKRIQGNVIGDESYFRGDPIGEGWQWNDLQWYFGAEASALSINGNSTDISISSAVEQTKKPTVTTSDEDNYVQVTNNIATVERGAKYRIGVHKGPSDNNVVVWGDFPLGARGYGVNLSVHRPALWASRQFVREMKAHGISVDGEANSRDWQTPEKERFDPAGWQEVAFVLGKPLGEIVKITNKHSVNLYSELLLRTLGREREALLPVHDASGPERGDEVSGAEVVRLWLSRAGIKSGNLAIHDGSGLSRLDLVTPEATARLLQAIRATHSGEIFTRSLPIASTDGTLQGRLNRLSGRVVAKTGALTYDNALSGYLTATDGQVYAFSVICNDSVARGGAVRMIDRLITVLADGLKNRQAAEKPAKS